MEQKSTDKIEQEIILNLLKKRNYIRSIAKELNISHTTVLRKVNALVSINVLDSEKIGKSKVFYLKKNLRARNYVYMAEFYKINKFLEKYPRMGIILSGVLKLTNAKLIIIFGSYAKFVAGKNSDIDIFIEAKSKKLKEEVKLIDRRINLKLGQFNLSSNLAKEIIKSHIIIKGVEEFYEKTKFFG